MKPGEWQQGNCRFLVKVRSKTKRAVWQRPGSASPRARQCWDSWGCSDRNSCLASFLRLSTFLFVWREQAAAKHIHSHLTFSVDFFPPWITTQTLICCPSFKGYLRVCVGTRIMSGERFLNEIISIKLKQYKKKNPPKTASATGWETWVVSGNEKSPENGVFPKWNCSSE